MRNWAWLLFGLLVVVALWIATPGRTQAPGRSARASGQLSRPKPEFEFPVEPAAFVRWWNSADPAARKQATALLRSPGAVSDALIVALVDSDDRWEVFRGLGPRALPLLRDLCLRPDEKPAQPDDEASLRRQRALGLAMMILAPEERQPFMVACLQHPDEGLRGAVAEWILDDPRFTADLPLRRALGRAVYETPVPDMSGGIYSGPIPPSMGLFDALVSTLDPEGKVMGELMADEDAAVRSAGAGVASEWVGARSVSTFETEEERKAEREVGVPTRGRIAIDLLLRMLADPEVFVRNRAMRALADLGNDGLAVPKGPLLARLADVNEEGRARGLAAIARSRLNDDATKDLLPYLDDPSAAVRAAVLRGLRHEMDRQSPDPALQPRFLAALQDGDAGVRAEGATALGAFAGSPDARCRKLLLAGLDDPEEAVRLACARALDHRGARAVEAIGHLQRWLARGSEQERAVAVRLAPSLGERAAPLEAELARVAEQGEYELRLEALDALRKFARLEGTLEVALKLMKDQWGGGVRLAALKVLVGRFGDRRRVHTALEGALSDTYAMVIAPAAEALAKRGLATAKVVLACGEIIRRHQVAPWNRRTAIEVLGRYGREALPAVPSLLQALDNPPGSSWEEIVNLFASLPALAERTVPALVERVVQGDWLAIRVLRAMGRDAQPHLARSISKLSADRRKAFEAEMERQRQASKRDR